MRNLLLASAVAVSAVLSFGVSAQADDMNGHSMHHDHMHKHCMMKSVKHHDHHGHSVWTKEKVCY
ncbi:hypothetical protein [Rhizobium tubonense]|uniref:hypothetical protein n=1 Tax=Rhizobium tubonense TaxID=484088 RepID=UPI000DAA090B|nr:hypothetical protein [Rhizobium tubonense]